MYKKNVLDYFNTRVQSLEHYCTLALERNEPEGVHQMRVENKRLKAFFCLLESINAEFKAKKNFAKFRKLSKSAGHQRDAFIQLELFAEVTDGSGLELPGYRDFIRNKEAAGWNVFRAFTAIHKISKLDEIAEAIDKALSEVPKIQAENRAGGHFESLCQELDGYKDKNAIDDQIMHRVRILSKETHFTFQIIQHCFNSYSGGLAYINNLKQTHQLLGQWHDCEICQLYLKEFSESLRAGQEPPELEKVKEKVLGRKNRLKTEFLKINTGLRAPFRSTRRRF